MSEHCPKPQLIPPCTASMLKLALQALRTRCEMTFPLGWKTSGCHHHSPIAGEDSEFRHRAVKLSTQALKKWVPRPNALRDEKAKAEDGVGLAGSAKETGGAMPAGLCHDPCLRIPLEQLGNKDNPRGRRVYFSPRR